MINEIKKEIKEREEKMTHSTTLERAQRVEPGNLIAFYDEEGMVQTALVLKNNNDNLLYVEDYTGANKFITYPKIIWVRTTKRWPKWLFNQIMEDAEKRNKKIYGGKNKR